MTTDHEPAGPGKALPPSSGFAGDDGSADPALAALLDTYAAGSASLSDVVARLGETRVLVPILAELERGRGRARAHGGQGGVGRGRRHRGAGRASRAARVHVRRGDGGLARQRAAGAGGRAPRGAVRRERGLVAARARPGGTGHGARAAPGRVGARAGQDWSPAVVDGVVVPRCSPRSRVARGRAARGARLGRAGPPGGGRGGPAHRRRSRPRRSRRRARAGQRRARDGRRGVERVDGLELRVGRAD